ncbi:MAG: hypothetical protein IVW57_12595 [Ktedonobacterales bacterium]|nr:hypothetical protein [Ktedonobacterales bacterium]
MTLILHLAKAAFRAFFRIILTALASAAVAGGATLLVAYQTSRVWPPKTLTEVAAGAIAILAAYAGALTVLIKEAIKGVATVEQGVTKGVEEEVDKVKR